MKNKSRLTGSVLTAFAAVLMLTIPVAGNAQVTTSSIRGIISAPDGQPATGVTVTVTDTRTGRVKGATTSGTGRFTLSGLPVGGPYIVATDSDRYSEQTITDVYLSLGEAFEFSVALGEEAIDEITVTAAQIQTALVAIGPSTSFNFDDLQNLPAINRDIRDVVRVDPRVYIDEGFVGAVQCLGANPRFNSLTVDGVKLNDNFGLNSNGFPTQRQPFPFDAIENVSLELSPYDVQYGGFTACNINAVTRSGGNKFSGRVWMDYTDDSLGGDKLEGDAIPTGEFDETRYGVSFSGPIIKDKLFFFAAYEKLEGADLFDRCAGDESCATPVLGVSRAQLDRISSIASTLYGYEPGGTVQNAPNEDEKFLLRMDWNINDQHNASLRYTYNDGFNISQSDNRSNAFEFSNHFYERGAELTSYSGQLFSDWTDNFSTEVKIAYGELDNRQISQNDQGFGEVQIETYFDGDGDGDLDQALVYLGGDDSRQSNKLNYDTTNLKFAGTYTTGDHVISGGFEREEIDVFNLFLQHTIGENRFDEDNLVDPNDSLNVSGIYDGDESFFGCSGSRDRNNDGILDFTASGCIDQFEAFSPDDIYYGNSAALNPADAAAKFASAVNSVYLQDEFTVSNLDLTIVAGLRYDWYDSDDLPRANSLFEARSGFTNRKNFDGESLLQPRLGFSYGASDDLTIRGGVGLYSGGNPNVWLGNNYQNDGFTQVQVREFQGGVSGLNTDPNAGLDTVPLGVDGNGRPIFDAPQGMIDAVTSGTANTGVNSIAPNFNIPSNWKYSLGATWLFDAGLFGDGYTMAADIVFSQSEDSATIVDDTNVQIGTAPDGRPIYFQTDKSIPGCEADPLSDPGLCDRQGSGDYILTNVQGSDAESTSFSFTLSKAYDFGLDWTFGYAYTEADDVNPMTSSVAFSNYSNTAVSNTENPGQSTSNYEIPNRFILKMGYKTQLFGENTTRFTMFASRNEGRPYSYTFNQQEMFAVGPFFNFSDNRSLLYMPSGPSDPNVVFLDGFNQAEFFAFADAAGISGYGGGIVPRNVDNSNWFTKVDLRISQEIPGFSPEQHGTLFVIIENVGNLLNDDWGVFKERAFPRTSPVVNASLNDSNQYVFESFNSSGVGQTRVGGASLWSMRVGFNYNFN